MKEFLKSLFIIFIMGVSYMVVELLYRGHTYVAMGVVGGITGYLIGMVNKVFAWDTPLWIQGLIGMCIGTVIEFISGCILNLWLGLNMWSYLDTPFNLLGQIALPFCIAWFGLALIGIFADDFIRWKMGEEKPRYKIFLKKVVPSQ